MNYDKGKVVEEKEREDEIKGTALPCEKLQEPGPPPPHNPRYLHKQKPGRAPWQQEYPCCGHQRKENGYLLKRKLKEHSKASENLWKEDSRKKKMQ